MDEAVVHEMTKTRDRKIIRYNMKKEKGRKREGERETVSIKVYSNFNVLGIDSTFSLLKPENFFKSR